MFLPIILKETSLDLGNNNKAAIIDGLETIVLDVVVRGLF